MPPSGGRGGKGSLRPGGRGAPRPRRGHGLGSARLGSALNYAQPRGPQAGQHRPAPGSDRRWRGPVPRAPALPRRPARPGVAHRCRHFPSRARARPSEPWPRPNRHVPSPTSHSSGSGIRAALRSGAGPRRDARRRSILAQTKYLIHLSVTIVFIIRMTLTPCPRRHESAAIRGATGAGPAGLVRSRSRADFAARCRPAAGPGKVSGQCQQGVALGTPPGPRHTVHRGSRLRTGLRSGSGAFREHEFLESTTSRERGLPAHERFMAGEASSPWHTAAATCRTSKGAKSSRALTLRECARGLEARAPGKSTSPGNRGDDYCI